jgi:AraC-like DNA-binding protein
MIMDHDARPVHLDADQQDGARRFNSYAEFYESEHGANVHRRAKIGAMTMFELRQPAGDLSDKATPDLLILRTRCRARARLDLGAGRFEWFTRHGEFVINPPNLDTETIVLDRNRIDVISIPWTTLQALDPDEELPPDGDFGAIHASMFVDRSLNRMFDDLWRLDGGGDGLQAETATVWIKERLLLYLRSGVPPVVAVEKLTARAVRLCADRLLAEGQPPATLRDLADLCGLSPHHLCRAFKAATGLPPHRWLIMRRMERARDLLVQTTLPVAEVAVAVGYDDPAYFSRLFARETGCPPGVWRRDAV